MKKLLLSLAVAASFMMNVKAQCLPDFTIPAPGLKPAAMSLNCATQSVAYDQTVTIKNFSTVPGYSVDSVFIDSVRNLPCGIRYAIKSQRLLAGEVGCMQFRGTTTDPAGQYALEIWVRVYGTPALPGGLQGSAQKLDFLAALGGYDYRYWFRVEATAGSCGALDTNRAFMGNKTASCASINYTGIESASISNESFEIVPNPANGIATLSFTSSANENSELMVFNMAGEKVISLPFNILFGDNKTAIDVSALQSGVYMVSIRNGKNLMTKRLIVSH